MKVLQLSREYPPEIYGGAGVVVGHLSRALARRMEVEVRCWGEGERQDGDIPVRTYQPWDRLAKNDDGTLYPPALETLSIALDMTRDPVDADVVHAHTWYADMGGLWTKIVHQIPLVVTLHSMEPLRPWKVDQLGSGYHLSSWIEKTTVEAADRVIAVSAGMKADILEHYDVAEEKVVVIHNGIEPDVYKATGARDALDRYGVSSPYVLFVGRISDQKGIFDLIEASRKLPEGVQLVLCAAAPDTPELLERMKTATAGRTDILWINEMVGKADVIQLYTHAEVFACPSVYEPFGIINLEAMGCGTAVVASGVGGILEVVVDGETGFLTKPSDPDGLAAALNRVLADPALAKSMGEAGRRRVEDKFSWESVAVRTKELYEKIAAK
jgi:alpha-maltose-1-phosphate synthase